MNSGGRTPEELETLLEDGLLLHDAEAVAGLFEDASVLVWGPGSHQARGHAQIKRLTACLCRHRFGYLADPRRVFQAHDTALLLGDGVSNVVRRGTDGSWRYAISVLSSCRADLRGGGE